MVKKHFLSTKYILLQTIILIFIISIPLHFYIQSELENNFYKNKENLQIYAEKVEKKIYKFSNSNERVFYYPRSNIYKSAIYDLNKSSIFSLFPIKIELFDQNIITKNGKIYFQKRLRENILNASYMLVSTKISYVKIILNVIIMLIVIAFLVFLVIFFIIKQSAQPYKQFNTYLENFIKDAMHEMKTPIGVVLLNLDGLDSIYNDNKMIKRAKSAIKNMMIIYDDLEFFVRKNRVEHTKENINLSQFTVERIEFFKDLLDSKEIRVIQNINDDLYIKFSKLELSRILDNTISNAIKYSKNSTKIEISLQVTTNDNNIELSIKDEGKGIQDISKIFDRYYRGDKISGGFGIGLNIVKNICDQNNVKIEVKSYNEKGSQFLYYFIKDKSL